MNSELKRSQKNLALGIVFVGTTMALTHYYREDIEPYRQAARETIASVLSVGNTSAQASPVKAPAQP